MKDSLGDRMKNNYEKKSQLELYRRMPVIMRLDGKAFHTLTRNCEKPFDKHLSDCMEQTMLEVISESQGSKIGYTQSDEISILFTDYDTHETQAWFDYNVQKLCSVASSIASVKFTETFGKRAHFDCRVFNIPRSEVMNYFIWRQQDWMRNSVQMLARYHFTQKELQYKTIPLMHEMLYSKNINWGNNVENRFKNGCVYINKELRSDIIFKENRNIIEDIVNYEEDK